MRISDWSSDVCSSDLVDDVGARSFEDRAAEAGNAHLEALEVLQRADLLVEPAASLDAGVAGDEELAAQLLVDLFGDLQAAAELHPGVLFLGVEAKGHGGEELGGRDLAYPVVRGAVAHLDGAVGDGIHGLEGRDDLAAAI